MNVRSFFVQNVLLQVCWAKFNQLFGMLAHFTRPFHYFVPARIAIFGGAVPHQFPNHGVQHLTEVQRSSLLEE